MARNRRLQDEPRLQNEPAWPLVNGERVIFLLDGARRRLLTGFVTFHTWRSGRAGQGEPETQMGVRSHLC